jgi:ABC-type amino acid transport substrate-binding protein
MPWQGVEYGCPRDKGSAGSLDQSNVASIRRPVDRRSRAGCARGHGYQGSPTSMVTDPKTGQTHGLTYDLGREFARRLGVGVEYVTFARIPDVIDGMKNGRVDFTVSNATPARAQDVDFRQPLISVELGYLVPQSSTIHREDEIDGSGVRLGVTKGGTPERTLSAKFQNATIDQYAEAATGNREFFLNKLPNVSKAHQCDIP